MSTRPTVAEPTPPVLATTTELEPVLVSVAGMARYLGGLPRTKAYELLDRQVVESRYIGRRRMVVVESLKAYAASLPATRD